jgi:hypothetical protein
LCGGFVTIVFAAMGIFWTGSHAGFSLCWIVAGAGLGFLVHNLPPAKIFMGDAGSLPLGFLCAALALPGIANAHWGRSNSNLWEGTAMMLASSILLAVPILDTLLVTTTRILSARNPMQGGQDHTSHRMARLLASENRALAFFLGMGVLTSAVFPWIARGPSILAMCAGGIFWLGVILFGNFLAGADPSARDNATPLWRILREWMNRYAVIPILFDAVLLLLIFPAAYSLRFDFHLGSQEIEAIRRSLPILSFCVLGAGILLGTYAVPWSQASSLDYLRQAGASVLGTLVALATITLATRFEDGYSRSAYLMFGILFVSGQATARCFQDFGIRLVTHAAKSSGQKPVLIYGAGKRGRLLAEACGAVPELAGFRAVAFFDDNENLLGKRLDGLPVITPESINDLPAFSEIWISTPEVNEMSIRNNQSKSLSDCTVKRLVLELQDHGKIECNLPL